MADPTKVDVKEYMGPAGNSYTDTSIDSALAAEKAAQARVCRVGTGELVADLREALLRRVARNLALRRLPLGVQTVGDLGTTQLGSNDPEIRRLEKPYRKLPKA